MNCEHALGAMLDADLPDVINGATSPLAVHVRGCTRCRRVAGQLMNDTRLLASAVAASAPVRRNRIGWRVAAPAAVAAALLVMLTMRQQTPTPRSVPERGVTGERPAVRSYRNALSPVTRLPSPVTQPRQLRAFPRAQPMVASKIAAPVAIDPPVVSSAVTVTPPAGTTALVMHTSDPKLLVVWLY